MDMAILAMLFSVVISDALPKAWNKAKKDEKSKKKPTK